MLDGKEIGAKEVVRQDGEKNVFISPVSVAPALSMVYNSAAGETKEAMAEVLRVRGVSIEDVNRANAALLKALNSNPDVQLDLANSVWARKDVTFNAEFLKTLRDCYGAESAVLDFNDPGAPDTINSWVQDKTKSKINGIIEEIKPLPTRAGFQPEGVLRRPQCVELGQVAESLGDRQAGRPEVRTPRISVCLPVSSGVLTYVMLICFIVNV